MYAKREVLEYNMMLVAGPPASMSLLDIRDLHAPYFYSKKDGWYAEDHQKFSRDDKVETRWLMIRKDPVPGSLDKTLADQQPLISEVEYVPNATEAVWAVTTYKAVRGVYLFQDIYVHTSFRDSDGYCVLSAISTATVSTSTTFGAPTAFRIWASSLPGS